VAPANNHHGIHGNANNNTINNMADDTVKPGEVPAKIQRALVTGGGGFLGGAIVELLSNQGFEVRLFSRGHYPQWQARGVDCVQGDLRDADQVHRACDGVDTVFHVAAVAGIWGKWKHYHDINTLGTLHVLEACRQLGVPRLVFTSSPSVTFAGEAQAGVDESVPYPTKWLCHYSHTKALAEQAVLAAHDENGLLTCALRPHLIWGPNDPHLVPRLIARARAGQLRQIGDGENLIDITYVDNAAEAHLQAAERLVPGSPVGGKAYFLSQGEPVRCWPWINEVLQLAGLEPIRRRVPYRAAWVAGAILEGCHSALRLAAEPRMTRFLASQLATSHYFDISAAQRDFGYSPRISTEEGMHRLAEWLVRKCKTG
jgi:2-alkyl-3-oxoalkanoate reductase